MGIFDEEEEKDEETKSEDISRYKRIKKNFYKFIAENGDDMIDSETREQINKKVRAIFAQESIPFTYMYIKAFMEGMQLGQQAHGDMAVLSPIQTVLLSIIIKEEDKNQKKAKEATDKLGL